MTLGSGQEVLKDWVFTTMAVNNGRARDHRAAIVATLRALREGQLGVLIAAPAFADLYDGSDAAEARAGS